MSGRFVGERLQPAVETADTSHLARGEPGLPERFSWREGTLVVARVFRAWRETGPCTHGSGERYGRRHWYEVEGADGEVARLYFERRGAGEMTGQAYGGSSACGPETPRAAEEPPAPPAGSDSRWPDPARCAGPAGGCRGGPGAVRSL